MSLLESVITVCFTLWQLEGRLSYIPGVSFLGHKEGLVEDAGSELGGNF